MQIAVKDRDGSTMLEEIWMVKASINKATSDLLMKGQLSNEHNHKIKELESTVSLLNEDYLIIKARLNEALQQLTNLMTQLTTVEDKLS